MRKRELQCCAPADPRGGDPARGRTRSRGPRGAEGRHALRDRSGRPDPRAVAPASPRPALRASERLLRIDRPEFRETVKEFAQLDGAFLLEDDGTFVSAGRFIDVDVSAPENFLPGLGTRHAAAASISRSTDAVAVVVSQSSVVRVFGGGDLRAEIIPELFLMARERLYTRAADVRQMPQAGVTLAVAGDRLTD
ncbi:MAG: DNA integrity scanning protein DisA nucleotide-binding domain protein [Actinobacteria bacterium]|nr:DNA integrity scanning protein DisA nucleotide-binding domain protein [Actinomycetota bacterium]